MLTLQNLTFSYKRKSAPVIDDMSADIESGKIYGLLGPNGAGKSTLLYLIMGMLTPKSGTVSFKGHNTRFRQPSVLGDIFLVPEEFDLPPISLKRYVELNAKYYPNFSNDDMQRHLKTFGMDSNPNLGQLSMGMKKKAFMSFALACNTSLLLMDEPTNGLDIPGKSAFRSFIASCMNDHRTIIISTHQVRDINTLLDHVIMIDTHRIICDAPVSLLTERFTFTTTNDPEVISRALFAQPSITGTTVILPNDGTTDTQLDLESLFQLALNNSNALNSTLNGTSGIK